MENGNIRVLKESGADTMDVDRLAPRGSPPTGNVYSRSLFFSVSSVSSVTSVLRTCLRSPEP